MGVREWGQFFGNEVAVGNFLLFSLLVSLLGFGALASALWGALGSLLGYRLGLWKAVRRLDVRLVSAGFLTPSWGSLAGRECVWLAVPSGLPYILPAVWPVGNRSSAEVGGASFATAKYQLG